MAGLVDERANSARVSCSSEGDVRVIAISGAVDLASADEVRSAVESVIGVDQEHVVFDLSALEFMDSSGISLLLGIAERVPTVEVRAASPIVRHLIEMTGLRDTLHLTP